MTTPSINRYKNYHFPAEIIGHAVWLYFRFCLSYRDVKGFCCNFSFDTIRGMISLYDQR